MNLQDLFEKYHAQVLFLHIYIDEAHPIDGWWLGKGLTRLLVKTYSPKVAFDICTPQTIDERRKAAGMCKSALQYGVRTYVDEMDDTVNKAYAAHPTRLYLIGVDGRVVYAGGLGPFHFHPRQLGSVIETYLLQK